MQELWQPLFAALQYCVKAGNRPPSIIVVFMVVEIPAIVTGYAYEFFSRKFFPGDFALEDGNQTCRWQNLISPRANGFRSCSRATWSFVSYDVPEIAPL